MKKKRRSTNILTQVCSPFLISCIDVNLIRYLIQVASGGTAFVAERKVDAKKTDFVLNIGNFPPGKGTSNL